MGERIIIGLVVFVIMLSAINVTVAGVSKSGEKNIRDTIIWIYNVYDLQNMSKDLNGNYALANDIDASITKTWNGGAGFEPIGDSSAPFNGKFDGREHKIINLWINRPSQDHLGLFGYTSGNAVIENVGLVNISISGRYEVGGLVGYNHYGIINKSYVTGNVGGNSWVGGLIGYNYYGTVNNSYTTSNVSGGDDVGGLIGYNDYGTIKNTYAAGQVSGSSPVGGLIGTNYGTITASFWDINTTGQTTSAGGTGKTTDEMKNKTTFISAGWNFTNIWNIWDGRTYPFFEWQNVKAVPSEPSNLQATADDGYVNLTWEAPVDDGGSVITEYKLYRNGTVIANVSPNQLWYNDTNVVNGITYTYYVTAVNSIGESDKSNVVQATPNSPVPEFSPSYLLVLIIPTIIVITMKFKKYKS